MTTDALLTQRKFCQDLCDADVDYAMSVKENQHKLLEDIHKVFESGTSILLQDLKKYWYF